MKVAVVGAGYACHVFDACLADVDNGQLDLDVDSARIKTSYGWGWWFFPFMS